MPRGKELEQLPMANISPGAGKDASRNNRRELFGSNVQGEQPEPSDIDKENEDMV
jgi:predicted nucleotidyltransferase